MLVVGLSGYVSMAIHMSRFHRGDPGPKFLTVFFCVSDFLVTHSRGGPYQYSKENLCPVRPADKTPFEWQGD